MDYQELWNKSIDYVEEFDDKSILPLDMLDENAKKAFVLGYFTSLKDNGQITHEVYQRFLIELAFCRM